MKQKRVKWIVGTIAILVIVPLVYLALFFRTGFYDQTGSYVLGEMRAFTVFLPASYEDERDRRYPVIYSLDGEKTRHGSLMAANARMLAAIGETPEVILVAVHTHGLRTRDYAPYKGAHAFTRFLSTELMPYIDKRFRTSGSNAISGHSYGGLYALYAFGDHPGLFDAHFAYVPSVFHYEPVLARFEDRLKNRETPKARVVLVSGAESQQKFWDGFENAVGILRENPNDNVEWKTAHFSLPHPLSMLPGQMAALMTLDQGG